MILFDCFASIYFFHYDLAVVGVKDGDDEDEDGKDDHDDDEGSGDALFFFFSFFPSDRFLPIFSFRVGRSYQYDLTWYRI